MRISQRFLVMSAVLALLLLAPSAASALTPADLDTSYGGTGTVTPALPAISDGYSVAAQPDGKIVGGYTAPGNVPIAFRLNTDGSLDSSFGVGGRVDLALLGATAIGVDGVLVAADGTIYLTGEGTSGVVRSAIWALTPTGAPKLSFNGTGSILLPSASGVNEFGGAALTASGSVVVAAGATPGADESVSVRVVSPTGVVTATGLKTWVGYDAEPTSVAVLPDGRFAVTVLIQDSSVAYSGMVAFTAGAVEDVTFGAGGFASFGPPIPLFPFAFKAFNLDGRIAVVGMVGYAPSVGLYLPTGMPIPGLESVGVNRVIPPGASFALLTDGAAVGAGRFVGAGIVASPIGSPPFIIRYNADGVPDTSFAPNGIANLPVAPGDGNPLAVLQPDGKYVIAVWRADDRLSLLRMWGDAPLPPTPLAATVAFSKSVKSKLSASKAKRFAGTAGGTGLSRVELAIQKVDSKLLKKSKKCRYVKSKSAALKTYKAVSRKCVPGIWLRASGTTKWSLKLSKKLAPGKYVLSARSTGVLGRSAVVKKSITVTK
jgi:uncharacterized delta-60 repeat protein